MAGNDIIVGGNPAPVDRAQPLRRKWETPIVIVGGCDETLQPDPTAYAPEDSSAAFSTRWGPFS